MKVDLEKIVDKKYDKVGIETLTVDKWYAYQDKKCVMCFLYKKIEKENILVDTFTFQKVLDKKDIALKPKYKKNVLMTMKKFKSMFDINIDNNLKHLSICDTEYIEELIKSAK